jgi:glucose/arabinose dehydrogenase
MSKMGMAHRPLAVLAALASIALVAAPAIGAPPPVPGVRLMDALPGVTFQSPVFVTHATDGSDDLFVVEQAGRILVVPKYRYGQGEAVGQPRVFLDITPKVHSKMQGGVLGLAFHPRYGENGRAFVSYLREAARNDYRIVLSEVRVQGGAAVGTSERVLLEIPKTRAIHNSGCLVFGPDGMLYMSTGDNGAQKEALQTSQNPNSLLGKILRIDVDRPSDGKPYGIPTDNPWAKQAGVKGEIFAYGFRNPWRFSFDGGQIWTADPGAKQREWVIRVTKAGNHGWPFFEGTQPAEPLPDNMKNTKFVPPFFEYERGADEGSTAAVGGHVYRGDRVKDLVGHYVFADYGRGHVYALAISGARGANLRLVGNVPSIASIGTDAQGELYFCANETGQILTMAPQ